MLIALHWYVSIIWGPVWNGIQQGGKRARSSALLIKPRNPHSLSGTWTWPGQQRMCYSRCFTCLSSSDRLSSSRTYVRWRCAKKASSISSMLVIWVKISTRLFSVISFCSRTDSASSFPAIRYRNIKKYTILFSFVFLQPVAESDYHVNNTILLYYLTETGSGMWMDNSWPEQVVKVALYWYLRIIKPTIITLPFKSSGWIIFCLVFKINLIFTKDACIWLWPYSHRISITWW